MKDSSQTKLRVGLVVNSLKLPSWLFTMIETLQHSRFADLTVLIYIKQSNTKRKFNRCKSIEKSFFYRVYQKIENRIFTPDSYALTEKNASPLLTEVPVLTIILNAEQITDILTQLQIYNIKQYNLDLLIDLSTIYMCPSLADTTRYGLWAFACNSKTNTFLHDPMSFLEVFEKRPVTCSMLQITRSNNTTPFVIARAYSATDRLSINRNLNRILWKNAVLLPKRIEALARLGSDNFFNAYLELNSQNYLKNQKNRSLNNPAFSLLLFRHLYNYLRYRIYHLRYLEQWILMFKLNDQLSTQPNDFKMIIPPLDRFWADPFVVWKDAKYYIFIEEFFYKNTKGHISVIEMDEEGNYGKAIKILETPFHLSYPFVFQYENKWFMIPDTNNNGTIESYICEEFPCKWSFHKTLMKGLTAVDPTLVQYNGKWWLFANIIEFKDESKCDNLYLFYADNPLSDNWTPHPLNPVVTDVRRSRPAGRIFLHNNQWIRPSQDSSKGYGFGIRLNRIVELSEARYKEEEIEKIMPVWDEKIVGMHTFVFVNKLNMIDAKLKVRR